MDVLLVIDMQGDFISGPLGTKEAQAILPAVLNKVQQFHGTIIFTRDTHGVDYASTQEGQRLPVPHCIKGSAGWELHPSLRPFATCTVDKPSFASTAICDVISQIKAITQITLVGVCTDICILSNALLLKAYFPETPIIVDARCCAGVTPQRHQTALSAMSACQIDIIEETHD